MFRPTGFNNLEGKKVGIFGFGIEGRAAAARLAQHAELVIVDDSAELGPEVLQTSQGGLEALAKCEVVLKSPGISPYRPEVAELAKVVTVTSALNLWMHEVDRDRVIGVTGTKGKSTTPSLITFFLNSLGGKAAALGNIGSPAYEPSIDTNVDWIVLELSSFQCRDLDNAPSIVAVTSLGADHLDWHRTVENYHRDKLSITQLSPTPEVFYASTIESSLFSKNAKSVAPDTTQLATALSLVGDHNSQNVALALAVASRATGIEIPIILARIRDVADEFVPLPGRLTEVFKEVKNGLTIRYIDDGLATAALPTVAALSSFPSEEIAIIIGGFDRGVDYQPLVDALIARRHHTFVVTMGGAGRRISDLILSMNAQINLAEADDLQNAVEIARRALSQGGVVLFSPAAPSFDQYKNWAERSAAFSHFSNQRHRDK